MSDKEYKARLLYIDAGDCKEVWEVKHINGGRQYVGRDTFDEHTWWTLCDAPYGYCERSGRIVPGVVFILCDAEWNPVARDGNDRTEFPTPYPTLEEASADAWAAVREQYPEVSKDGFGKWISGFADRPLSGADYMNWRGCQRETIQREVLSTFDYLGEQHAILRFTVRHTECTAQWQEYYVGIAQEQPQEAFSMFLGYSY